MKLGINTLFYIPGQVGGSETYLLEILRVWKRMGSVKTLVLFTQRDNHRRLEDEFGGDGWACERLDFSAENRVSRIVREQVQLPGRVRRAGVDVLWSPGYTAPLRSPCPQAVSVLDMQYKSFPEDLGRVARWTTDFLVQSAVRNAEALVTISAFSKAEILRHTPATAEKVFVTWLAASADFESQSSSAHARPYLLCVANSYPHKNIDQLVRAFVAIEDQIPHDLVVVGRPRLGENKVEAAVGQLKNPRRFQRKAGLSREALAALYRSADLFVFPSLYEGFGLPVLEAMRAGVPVLTTPCGSIPEVGGDTVMYYDVTSDASLARGIVDLLGEDSTIRSERCARARQRAETFTWEHTAEKTLAVLRGLWDKSTSHSL